MSPEPVAHPDAETIVGRDADAPEKAPEAMLLGGVPFLVFALDNCLWAIPAGDVVHVAVSQRPMRVPTAPARLLGLVRVRQRIIGLVDLRALLGLPPQAPAGLQTARRLLVVHSVATDFAVEVDEVVGLQSIAEDSIRTPSQRGETGAHAPAVGQFDILEGAAVILSPSLLIEPLIERALLVGGGR